MTGLRLDELEAEIDRALTTGDETRLHFLGWGEIMPVLRWPAASDAAACKRLPLFDTTERLDAFRSCLHQYLAILEHRGTRVLDTTLHDVSRRDGRVAAYVTQPIVAPEHMGPAMLRAAAPDAGRALMDEILERIEGTVDDRVGLDAQLSNWAWLPDGLVYIDVTTPLLRDEHGAEMLDTELFLASLPAALRPVVRRFLLDDIVNTYYEPHTLALDLAGNLYKEGLDHWVPELVAMANRRFGLELTVGEVQRYYRRDARLWGFLQKLRRLDRTWQRRVRRRVYPSLLPGPIERRAH